MADKHDIPEPSPAQPPHRTEQPPWTSHLPLAAILFLTVVVRLLYCFEADAADVPWFAVPALGTDQEMYLSVARRILSTGRFGTTVDANPLYPMVVLPVLYGVSDQDTLITHALQGSLLGMATVGLLFALGRRLCGPRVGLAAGVIAAIHPPFVVYDCAILSEPVVNVTTLAALVCIARLRDRRGWGALLLTGVAVGLAMLAKPALFVLAPLVLVALLIGRRESIARAIGRTAVVGAAAALTIAPMTIRNSRAVGEFIPIRSNGAQVFLMGNNPDATGRFTYLTGAWADREEEVIAPFADSHTGRDAARFRLAVTFIRSHPGRFLALTGRKLLMVFEARETGNNLSVTLHRQLTFLRLPILPGFGWILGFALPAPFVCRRRCRGLWLVHAFIGLYAVTTALFVVVSRYRLPVTLCLSILAGALVVRVIDAAMSRRWRFAAVLLAAALLCTAGLHYRWIYRHLVPVLKPNGFVEQVDDETIAIRDDLGRHRWRFTRLTSPAVVAEKRLVVSPDYLPAERASVEFGHRTAAGGLLDVEVNGHPAATVLDASSQGFAHVEIPPEWLVPGVNVIRFRAGGGVVTGIVVTDRFRFGRSRWRDEHGRWHSRYLDRTSCLNIMHEHLLSGEYVVRLLLHRPAAIAAP